MRDRCLDASYEDRLKAVEDPLKDLLESYHDGLAKNDKLFTEGVEAAARGMAKVFEEAAAQDARSTTEQVHFLKAKFPEPSSLDFENHRLPLVDEEYTAPEAPEDDTLCRVENEGEEIIPLMDMRGVIHRKVVGG